MALHRAAFAAVIGIVLGFGAGVRAQTTAPASRPASAPASAVKIRLVPDRADALYAAGDTATFAVTVSKHAQPASGEVSWAVFEDGVKRRTGTTVVRDGHAEVAATLGRPGFVRIDVTFEDGTGSGGAGFDVAAIKPSAPEPADFDAFWADQKRRLAETPVALKVEEVPSGSPDVRCFAIETPSAVGMLRGYLARPAHATAPLPAMITIRGSGVFDSQKAVAVMWARAGFLALDWNLHGLEQGREKAYYQKLRETELLNYTSIGTESRETYYMRGVILRLLRATDVVCQTPEWDRKHLVLNGVSQGGGLALIGGALDSRVSLVVAQIPAMCDRPGGRAARGDTATPAAVEALRYSDVVNFAPRCHAKALVTADFLDQSCYPTGVHMAYNRLAGPKRIENFWWLPHTFSPHGDSAMWQAVLDHVRQD